MIRVILLALWCFFPTALWAQDTLRVSTWNVELIRKGPGLLLRDMVSAKDAQIAAAARHIGESDPDILLLTGFDTDMDGHTLSAFAKVLRAEGTDYPFLFTRTGNAGLSTGRDLDKDGRFGEPEDAQSYGNFRGEGGMALLSRLPILTDGIRDFTGLLWRDIPEARYPVEYYDDADLSVLRLSSNNHWDVPLQWGETALNLFAFHATTPAFDGGEDRNGLRNADEIRFWRRYLDGQLSVPPPKASFILLGDANLDLFDGDGRHEEMTMLLADPRFIDPRPRAANPKTTENPDHIGYAALDTADWDDPVPGNLRVDYVLPSADLAVIDAGVAWVASSEGGGVFRHGLVWVDIARQ